MKRKILSSLSKEIKNYLNVLGEFSKHNLRCNFFVLIIVLFSQAAMLLSFVLPLKMIFLIGAKEFKSIDIENDFFSYTIATKDELAFVFILVFVSVVFFYFFLEIKTAYQTKKCLNNVPKLKNDKSNTFIEKLYKKCINGVSGLVTFVLILFLLLFLYPKIVGFIIMYCIVVFLLIVFMYNHTSFLHTLIENNFNKLLNALSLILYMIVFIMITMDLIGESEANDVIVMVISFLLLRKAVEGLKDAFLSIDFVFVKKKQIEKILYMKVRK
ncbi:hypothetical protein ACFLR3_04355 [Campylobacterota bacterium]